MNILDVIKDCISNPSSTKDYTLEDWTMDQTLSNDQSVTNKSSFSGYTSFKQGIYNSSATSIDQKLLRLYMRIWAGLGRLIKRVIIEGNCFISFNLGYFYILDGCCVYSPTIEIIENNGLIFIEDKWNIGPINRIVLCKFIIDKYS